MFSLGIYDPQCVSPEIYLTCRLSLLVHSKPRIREISSAALTNMMASGKGMELVHQSIPGLVQLFEKMVQPAFDEVTTINVCHPIVTRDVARNRTTIFPGSQGGIKFRHPQAVRNSRSTSAFAMHPRFTASPLGQYP